MSFSIERFFRKDSIRSLVALTVLAGLILSWDFADDPYLEAAAQKYKQNKRYTPRR